MARNSTELVVAVRILCWMVLTVAAASCSQRSAPLADGVTHAAHPDAAAAAAFVKRASQQLEEIAHREALTEFTYGVDGTPEHAKALEQVQLEQSHAKVALWKEAKAFDGLKLPPDTARQILVLRTPPATPAPFDDKLAAELFSLQTTLTNNYTNAQDCISRSPCRPKTRLYDIMKTSRVPAELLSAWQEWHDAGAAIRAPYARSVELLNAGAHDFAQTDAGATLRAQYEIPPAAFAAEYDRLWAQIRPLYEALHCHVRAKLHEHYGALVPEHGLIPAHLLGNMWGQYWQDIDSLLGIPQGAAPINVTQALQNKHMGPTEIVRTAEGFFRSMGFPDLPQTFWKESVLAPVPGKKVDCHASAWPIDPTHSDVRLKMCVETSEEDFRTAHHELGHIYYYLAYAGQPFLFQDGANPGFHEALGDTIALSITPSYLEEIGLAPRGASASSDDLPYLMRVALEKIPTLATAVVVDTWRWKVYSGEVTADHYEQAWWEQVRKYQGFAPPTARTEKDFDPGMFYHISYGVPYDRYFTAGLLEFDFYRALCKAAGYTGELHRCSFYGNKAAGDRLRKAMQLGASTPWPEILQELTGSRQMDGSAIVEYLAPVQAWLKKQNEGRQCGWE